MVDEFVIFDTAQYTRSDWRNRNKIYTDQGLHWLSIPIRQVSLKQNILGTKITDEKWSVKHWRSISQSYSKSKFFNDYAAVFEEFYLNCSEVYLSKINYSLIRIVNDILDISTKITSSSDYCLVEGQTEKLLNICKQANANIYLSGPAAKIYFDTSLAEKMGVSIEWIDYTGYPEYTQLHSPFEHSVTILDLIFNEGPNAKKFMKSFKS